MSHPIPGHDYSDQHNQESNKEYAKRRRASISKVAKKMKPSKESLAFNKRIKSFNKKNNIPKQSKKDYEAMRERHWGKNDDK